MQVKVVVAIVAAVASLAGIKCSANDAEWDAREARTVREELYVIAEHLPDFPQIKATFERALANDPACTSDLANLAGHSNQDVASAAAKALGRFATASTSTRLKDVYEHDARTLVRLAALGGLARMRDPAAVEMAVAALSSSDSAIQGGGLGALEALGSDAAAQGDALLAYMDRQEELDDPYLFEVLAAVGDKPGSTVVRDRLVGIARSSSQSLDLRIEAARAVKSLGAPGLVQDVLDRASARLTGRSLLVVQIAMIKLAGERGVSVRSQGDVDALLAGIDVGRHKVDDWGRPLRASFVRDGVFKVTSDGPDRLPGTADDMTAGEPLERYLGRVFPE